MRRTSSPGCPLADLRELGTDAERGSAVLAGEEAVHPPADLEIQRAQERLGHRPGAGAVRRALPREDCGAHAARSHDDLGHGDDLEDGVDDGVGADVGRQRLVAEDDPVVERVAGELADVLREDVVTAADERERASRGHQRDRPSGAGAERHVRG